MEILNDEKTTEQQEVKNPLASAANLFAGILMVVCGIVWLLSNYNIVGPAFINTFFSWQMLIVAVGGWLLCARNWTLGGIVTAVGVALLLFDVLNIYISFTKLILPLLLVVAGVILICQKGIKRF